MKQLFGISAGILALCLPALAQAPAAARQPKLTTVAYGAPAASPQDQDDRDRHDRDRDRDRDRNGNWDSNRDRDWHRNHDRNHRDWDDDRDRDWHRQTGYGQGNYGNNGYYGGGYDRGYQGVLAPEWQQKYDSYYQRWLNYRATNNQSEMRSMEGRMRDVYSHYGIPGDVPFGDVAGR